MTTKRQTSMTTTLRILLLTAWLLWAAEPLSVAGQAVEQPTRKERLHARRERVKQRLQTKEEKLRAKRAELQEKARQKRAELKEKGEVAAARADSIIDARNRKVTTDTLWVARPANRLTLRAKTDMVGDLMHFRAVNNQGQTTNYLLNSDPKVTLGFMANYKGVSASLSLSPTKLVSDISDIVSSLNYYNNTFGVDLTMEKIDAFRGRDALRARRRKLPNTNLTNFAANAYYVFNGKRFSLPAVFNSTWVQKRSAGSFMVQAGFSTGRLKIGDDLDPDNSYDGKLNRIDMRVVTLGAGYGYNLILGRHWLVHATMQPSAMLWKRYRLHTLLPDGTEEVNRMPASHANLYMIGRLGAIYSWSNYFVGLTGVVHYYKTGSDDDFSLRDAMWKGRAFFGWRL